MPARRVMGGRVTAGRVVAAADVPARLAHAQVDPLRAGGQALPAAGDRLGELEAFYRVEVGAASHAAMVAASDLIAGGRESQLVEVTRAVPAPAEYALPKNPSSVMAGSRVARTS